LWALLDEIEEIRHDSKVPVSRKGYLDLWDEKDGVAKPIKGIILRIVVVMSIRGIGWWCQVIGAREKSQKVIKHLLYPWGRRMEMF
jgi:hypothetical protein